MANADTRFDWVKIFLPLLFMAGLSILPFDRRTGELLNSARVAELDDQPRLAAVYLYELLDRQPWRVNLWERAGVNQLAGGDDSSAIQSFERASSMGQLSLQGEEDLALAYERAGQYADAARAWNRVAERTPSVEVYAHAAQNWRRAGAYPETVQALRGWQALEPSNAAVAYSLGVLLAGDMPDEAMTQLSEAARLDALYANAQADMQRALSLADLNDDEGYRLTVIGRALANMGEWEQAELVLTRATQANPSFAEAWALLGEAREQVSKDGLPDLEKAIETNPQSIMARAMLALYWGRLGEWDKAIAHLQVASRVEPGRAVWRMEMGSLYAQSGDLARAQEELLAAVELEPKNVQTWHALAAFSLRYDVDLEGIGLPAAEEALALDDQNALTYDLLGSVLVELDRPDEGEKNLLRALEIDPDLAEAHYHLGSLYLQRQSNDKAFDHLVQAGELDGSGTTGTLARRLLERYFNQSVKEGGQP
jgi:tetratricopeptide (TPR) repeat protein